MSTLNPVTSPKAGAYMLAKRKAAGLTLRELETLTGITCSHLCRVENGRRRFPIASVPVIAKALDVCPHELTALALTEHLEPADQVKLAHAILAIAEASQ